MAVTNQLSLCMPWLRTGTIDCAVPDLVEIGEWPHVLRPKLRDVDWKTCYGKEIRSSKRLSNLQPTDAMGKKNTCFFHDVFLLLIPNQANTLFWTFLLMSILSYIGALFGWQPQWGLSVSLTLSGGGTWWKWEQLRMDLCDYDLSLPPDHPYNLAVEFLGCLMSSQEGLV